MTTVGNRYAVDVAPNGYVVVELENQASVLMLTPKQARTLATKLRNAAFDCDPLKAAREALASSAPPNPSAPRD